MNNSTTRSLSLTTCPSKNNKVQGGCHTTASGTIVNFKTATNIHTNADSKRIHWNLTTTQKTMSQLKGHHNEKDKGRQREQCDIAKNLNSAKTTVSKTRLCPKEKKEGCTFGANLSPTITKREINHETNQKNNRDSWIARNLMKKFTNSNNKKKESERHSNDKETSIHHEKNVYIDENKKNGVESWKWCSPKQDKGNKSNINGNISAISDRGRTTMDDQENSQPVKIEENGVATADLLGLESPTFIRKRRPLAGTPAHLTPSISTKSPYVVTKSKTNDKRKPSSARRESKGGDEGITKHENSIRSFFREKSRRKRMQHAHDIEIIC